MKVYIKGEVVAHWLNGIIIEKNCISLWILLNSSNSYDVGQKIKLYIYEHNYNFEKTIYGFYSLAELQMFINLIAIKNIGPKKALKILQIGLKIYSNLLLSKMYCL